jgi:hypothetical protein
MKKMIWVGFVLVCFTGVVSAQSITVKADRDLNTDFSKYKTFYWSSQVDTWLDEGVYFMNDLMMKSEVRDAVKGELMGLGYQLQSSEPDLIVNFRVFDKPVTLKGYEGYGTSYWGDQRYRDISDTASYHVDAGTLLVSMADRESGQVVWQGFASGLIKDDTFIKDEGKIREAVNLIFEEYNHRAKEYTRK